MEEMMANFSYARPMLIFLVYVVIDALYAMYIMSVEGRRAFAAALISSILYSLLAYGVVSYSQNILYLLPLASGAFVGTYLTVLWKGSR